ncbi:M23 family metallopeptidase [Streptomyces lycii]|uniref:Peptidoglycan DD-metalloendopeptidase family protein n=1 Tax=Streptomyces lycii TaxID=2654337 RepID=A0ABQ7FL19_9ACTN|nr:peptidoglycan DD-metalloendopeptidase family protein [Streptomyces lycii]KAF4408673.1 peptidoglycan DD-metalloendopeptidase family protein [Streptomyces lycii]
MARTSLTVTASGAGLALPLAGSGNANAAPAETWERVAETERAGLARLGEIPDAAAARAAAEAAERQRTAAPATGTPGTRTTDSYRVVSGDSLSRIALSQDVDGGWQQLYAANREVIGDDPDLILPGQRLTTATGDRTAAPPERKRGGDGRSGEDGGKAGKSTAEKPDKTEKTEKSGKSGKTDKAEKSERAGSKAGGGKTADRKAGERDDERASRSSSGGFSAPVPGVAPSTAYRASGGSWSSGYHTGVDFPVATGTSVKAVSAGKVVSAGWAGAYGYEVVLRHADGRYSQYAHLSQLSVRSGQQVGAGAQVGRSGSTGNSTGPHLHFEIRTGPGYGSDIDPLGYLRSNGVGV